MARRSNYAAKQSPEKKGACPSSLRDPRTRSNLILCVRRFQACTAWYVPNWKLKAATRCAASAPSVQSVLVHRNRTVFSQLYAICGLHLCCNVSGSSASRKFMHVGMPSPSLLRFAAIVRRHVGILSSSVAVAYSRACLLIKERGGVN